MGIPNIANYLRPSFLRHLNFATLANFWKSLNLNGAKIKISLFFFHFSTKRENGKLTSLKALDANWLTELYNVLTIADGRERALNGWKKSGITAV